MTVDGSGLRGVVVRNDPDGTLVKSELTEDTRKLVAALISAGAPPPDRAPWFPSSLAGGIAGSEVSRK